MEFVYLIGLIPRCYFLYTWVTPFHDLHKISITYPKKIEIIFIRLSRGIEFCDEVIL